MTTRRALRQSGTETTVQRAHRLAWIATASLPARKRRAAIDAFVAGFLACADDIVTMDDDEAERSTGARRPLLSRSETQ